MIFDSITEASNATNWDAVQESPYALGLEGGLMHVYENECNFNSIMKAAGIAELKYYKETGGDLFLQEAGAASGLIQRFVAFFRKMIEKIKQIFKKFVMKISSFVSKDKTFVKKYKKEVFKNFKEFNFTGWKRLVNNANNIESALDLGSLPSGEALKADTIANSKIPYDKMNDDQITAEADKQRGEVLKISTKIEADDFTDELHKALYGDDKEEFKVSSSDCALCFSIIENTEKSIKAAEDNEKKVTNSINGWIKQLEKANDLLSDKVDEKNSEKINTKMAGITSKANLYREYGNIATTAFSALIGALKDSNRQAKAICVKALNSGSRKDESAVYGGDIFASVEII